jgi:tellurite methyltransferase
VVTRSIDGFHQDDAGDWVAELSCLHGQHVRHRPPFRDRPWVLTAQGRDAHVGVEIDCPLCDRAELPDDLEIVRTAGPFDAATVPAGLQRDHRVGERTWGVLRVIEGAVGFTMATTPPTQVSLRAGDRQPIPPGVPHSLRVEGPVRLAVDFLVRPEPARSRPAPHG